MTQAQTPTPVAPQAPAQRVLVRTGDGPAVPAVFTARDVAALQERKNQLSQQLSSADSRRREVQRQLEKATGVSRTGLEQRLSFLDNRITRLEMEIDENSRALASLPAAQLAAARQDRSDFIGRRTNRDRLADAFLPISLVFTIFVLAPIAASIARLYWRRASGPFMPAIPAETSERLERMEQAMDAIAIEVERVSEGQRFVTRLLAENHAASPLALNQPVAEPVRVGANEALGTIR